MEQSKLHNEENWLDYGLSDYIETDDFPHWIDVAREIARIAGCEPGSPMEALFMQCAASSAKLGFDCDHCGKIARPLNHDGACNECASTIVRTNRPTK